MSGANRTGRLGLGDNADTQDVREVEGVRGVRVVNVAASRTQTLTRGHVIMVGVAYLPSADHMEVAARVKAAMEVRARVVQEFERGGARVGQEGVVWQASGTDCNVSTRGRQRCPCSAVHRALK